MKRNNQINSILVIEDDELTASLYHMMLTEVNLFEKIVVKTEPEEGLQYIKENISERSCPDLIFIDIKMQGLTGFELIEEINNLKKGNYFKGKIIILTSSSFVKDIEKARELLVDDYILKPLTKEKIYSVVEKYSVE